MTLETVSAGVLVPVPGSVAEINAALDAQAREYADRSMAPNTRRAYETDWAHFVGWCARHESDPLPATPDAVWRYVTDLANNGTEATGGRPAKTSTILRRVSSISVMHKAHGHNSPTGDAAVQFVLEGIARRGPEFSSAPKTAATTATVVRLVAGLDPDKPADVRDRAILLFGLAGAMRRSELAALDLANIVDTGEGLEVLIATSKTDQRSDGDIIGLPPGDREATSPVHAWQAWCALLADSGHDVSPAFRPVARSGQILPRRLSPQSVALIVKRRATAAGLDADDFAGHSLRSGFATTAARAGVEEREIMRQGRWKSVKIARNYVQRGRALDATNPARRLGL